VGKLIPDRGRERAEVKTWEALADGLLDAAILARLEATWPGRKEGERSQAWIDRQLKKIDDSLIAMDRALAERSNCVGIHLSLADIAVVVAVGYLDFRFPAIDWRGQHPNLGALHERLSQRQSFKDTLPN
jgi:glutathione S-transferase